MNIRTLYAIPMTAFAAFTAFYALMTLAFFFGEGHYSEWQFPLIITAAAAVNIWSAVALWLKKNALVPTGIALASVFGISGWIIIPPLTLDPVLLGIALVCLVALALLAGLAFARVRAALKT